MSGPDYAGENFSPEGNFDCLAGYQVKSFRNFIGQGLLVGAYFLGGENFGVHGEVELILKLLCSCAGFVSYY